MARRVGLASIVAFAIAVAGCSSVPTMSPMVNKAMRPFAGFRPEWVEAEGHCAKASWQRAGSARLQARHEAVAEARQKIWDVLADRTVDLRDGYWARPTTPDSERVNVEYLVVTNPTFESKLRALTNSLQPRSIEDTDDGALKVLLRMDANEALWLVVGCVERMNSEKRL
jgi:hypothetical protein